jgi:tetraacyldisaccharide 4'-kinase
MLSKPKFWQKDCFTAHLLLPFSALYFLFLRFKNSFVKTQKLNAKIICIGNAVVGGAGKTPTAIKISQIIKSQNPHAKIAFVSKGYKGYQKAPILIDLSTHTPNQVGDEPLLLAKHAPCFVGKNRVKTCQFAIEQGYQILILDDGLQDNKLHKDINFLVVDGGYGFGNFMPLPAGPLRDRIDFAAKNISAAIIIGKDEAGVKDYITRKIIPKCEIVFAVFETNQKPNNQQKYFAFAGIGRPEKFFETLQKNDFILAQTQSFSDHYYYNNSDEENLLQQAQNLNAKLITTEKDFVKLSPEFQKQVEVLKVELNLEEQIIKNILA